MTPTRPVPRRSAASGVPAGRIGGIPIVLSWSWLLSVIIIVILATPLVEQISPGTSTATAIAVSVLLGVLLGVSVLVHELGHCLAARALGLPVLEVRLHLLGGVSELGRLPSSAREEAVIAAAGPGLSALLSALFFLLVGSVPARSTGWLLLLELALSNAVVAVFNLLPALPLDGGRVLRAGVWKVSGRRRWGTVAASFGGYLIAVGLLIFGAVEIFGSSQAGVLEGVMAAATALFVAAGAWQEHRAERVVVWPAGFRLTSLARPVVQLPMEVPVALALQAAAGRAVVLTSVDGIASGLMDEPAAIALGRTDPGAPAYRVVVPIRPEFVVLPGDDPVELIARLHGRGAHDLLLVDDNGGPAGVIPAAEWSRILAGHPSGAGDRRPPDPEGRTSNRQGSQ